MNKEIILLQLYPLDMNIYGDNGNALVLTRRLEWYGYTVKHIAYNPGDTFPENVDIVVGGGGQDSGQNNIVDDLLSIGPKLRQLADSGTPMLMVCGLYQLFGHFFKTASGETLRGIGLLDVETHAEPERLIGNIIVDSATFGEIIGYENHSGQTFLGDHATPLGTVRLGAGNNTADSYEGARYKNVIGTYLHGSILPKNPRLADFLIEKAVIKKFGEMSTDLIDDHFADLARRAAFKRPR
jgi:CobQ-like glutamine amidotransferase family enzyme